MKNFVIALTIIANLSVGVPKAEASRWILIRTAIKRMFFIAPRYVCDIPGVRRMYKLDKTWQRLLRRRRQLRSAYPDLTNQQAITEVAEEIARLGRRITTLEKRLVRLYEVNAGRCRAAFEENPVLRRAYEGYIHF